MRGVPYLYSGFVGGLNSIDSAYTLEDNESRDCLNVVATTRGSIKKRNGSTQFLVSPPAVELTSVFPVNIAGTRWLVAFGGTKVYKINTSGATTDITGAVTITSGTRWEVVQAPAGTSVGSMGPVYMSNGVDPPLQWSGSGNVAAWTGASGGGFYGTSPFVPNGKYMTWAENRIWMTGVAGDPSAVYFSDLVSTGASGGQGDPTSWPLTNVVRFDSSDADPITGIGHVGPYLVVFKEFKAWVITDLNTGANRRLSTGVGCVAHRSIVATVNGTFFLSSDQGIFVTNGTTVEELSYKIRPTILAINQTNRGHAAGAFYGNHYYLSYPTGTSTANNRTLDYDLQLKSWWLHDLVANQWCVFEPVAGPALYAAVPGTSNGVAQCFVPSIYTDLGAVYAGANIGGVQYSAYFMGAWQRFSFYVFRHRVSVPMVKKRVRQIYFNGSGVINPVVFKNFNTSAGALTPGTVNNADASTSTLPITFSTNNQVFGNSDTTQMFGGSVYGGEPQIFGGSTATQDARIYAPGIAEEWSVGFGNSTTDPFEVEAYALAVQFRKS